MRKMLVLLIAVSLGCFLLLFSLLEATDNKENNPESAQNGMLDLSAWDFHDNQVVPLDGMWQFYWNQLLEPGIEQGTAPELMQVPGFWRQLEKDGDFRSKGAATYRLQVKVKPSSLVYGLRVSNIRMASEIYVNGQKVGGSGVPALAKSEYAYQNKPYNVYFPVQGDTAEILIYAANYENSQGGIPYPIYFGSAQGIQTSNTNSSILNLTLIVSLLMLGCYQLGIYIIRREEKGLLYFGLSCIVIAWSFASNGDRMIVEHIHMPTELYYKIQAVSLYFSFITMVMFIKHMCKGLISRRFTGIVSSIMWAYIAFVLVAPFQWYSDFNIVASTVQLGAYLIILGVLLHAYRKGRYGEFTKKSLGLFILALLCYFVGLIDFALYLSSLVLDFKFGYYAMLSFCFLSSFIMSYRFSEAYNTIENMAAKLRQADRQKDEFLLQTSHEFQTPLHGIINLSQNMLETGEELNASHRQNLSLIRDTSRRLSSLVHDILDMEKIKRNELTIHPSAVDVRITVSVVFDLFRNVIAGKKISLVNAIPPGLPPVYADENRLKQVIHNLVGNAAKFTQEGSITISTEAKEDRVVIRVEDTGVGIAPSQWETVFQPFEQAHSPYEYGGTGLGLSICRRLLHLMDGEIYIDWSEPDRGTGIAFTLPVAVSSTDTLLESAAANDTSFLAAGESPVDLPQQETGCFTLLAVDDESSNLQVLSRLFANEPYTVLWATNGMEALEILRTRTDIDLVLLDVMMPRMSGLEVCREIRKRFSLFELPIVLLTVLHAPSDIATGFKAGANDFIVKPFDASEVRARASTLLQLKKSVNAVMKAELDFLQSQIKPHFLFNALNSIIAICQTDWLRAEQLITHLSNYLRRSFEPRPDSFGVLQDELQLITDYVEIEKVRFDDRLTFLCEIPQEAMKKKILPLTIQPLVENAIRHGVMKRVEGGTVKLTVTLEEDAVLVEVWDNGVGMSPEQLERLWSPEKTSSKRRGVGLANIHRRLTYYYGETLNVASVEGEWTKVWFRFKL
jgi:two-component system, sensor histidine kinase ChiS